MENNFKRLYKFRVTKIETVFVASDNIVTAREKIEKQIEFEEQTTFEDVGCFVIDDNIQNACIYKKDRPPRKRSGK